MMLLVDLGNSRLKWVLAAAPGEPWSAGGSEPWTDDLAARLAAHWTARPAPADVFVASVVDGDREAQVDAAIRACFGIPPTWVRTPAAACGVRIAYADPARLGVDRFLGMVAAYAAGHAPCVLVSAGTALTLDALDAGGQHLGGLIVPGAQLMQDALVAATARVRLDRPGAIVDAACNTTDAVVSGSWQALAALVERFVARMAGRLGGAPAVLVGGGDADRLLPLLESAVLPAPDGVLHGLARWALDARGAGPSATALAGGQRP